MHAKTFSVRIARIFPAVDRNLLGGRTSVMPFQQWLSWSALRCDSARFGLVVICRTSRGGLTAAPRLNLDLDELPKRRVSFAALQN